MEQQKKESYEEPVLIAHELLRDVTGGASGVSGGQCQSTSALNCVL
ncbi:hypothetical protein [Nitrospira lenta]|nr:hypothetical protein [Nitrospira lenta]